MANFKKGDVVDFSYQPSGDGLPLWGKGIVIRNCYGGFWDILCEGKFSDMRLREENIKKVNHQNIFEIIREL